MTTHSALTCMCSFWILVDREQTVHPDGALIALTPHLQSTGVKPRTMPRGMPSSRSLGHKWRGQALRGGPG